MGETVDGRLLALRSIPRKRRFEAPLSQPSSLANTQSYLVLSQAAGLKRRQDAGACGGHEYGEWREASRKKSANIQHHCCEDVSDQVPRPEIDWTDCSRVADIIRSCLGPKAML